MKKSLFCGVCLSALVAMGGASFADVLLGVGAPLTGGQAAYGDQIKRGVEAAVAEANAKGGMNGEESGGIPITDERHRQGSGGYIRTGEPCGSTSATVTRGIRAR